MTVFSIRIVELWGMLSAFVIRAPLGGILKAFCVTFLGVHDRQWLIVSYENFTRDQPWPGQLFQPPFRSHQQALDNVTNEWAPVGPEPSFSAVDPFVQTFMLTPCSMENGRKGVEKLPTRKMFLKLGTILVQICLVSKISVVPSDQISKNEGS